MKRVILIVFAVLLGAVLVANRSESVFGADSSGYANLARMLARGETTRPLPAPGYPPLGFVPLPDGRMASFYPIGLPIHLALFPPFFVSPLAGVALVLLTFRLGRQLHSELAGLIAALLMGFCAVFVFQALQPMSDVLAAMWSVAAITAAVEGRERPRFDLLAGFCFGIAVLVRPTSILLLLPLALALARRLPAGRSAGGPPARPAAGGPAGPRPALRAALRFALFLLGGIPAALVLGWYNLDAFGSLVGSGYSAGGATREFALAYFVPRALHYARWTTELLSPIAILAAIGALAIAKQRWLLLSWFAAFFVFYSFYYSYHEWWYTRFLLPAYPALAVAAGIAIAQVTARWRVAGVLLIVAALTWEGRQVSRFAVLYTDEDQHLSRVPVEWAARALPPRSLVFSQEFSGSLLYYSGHRPVRWDLGPPLVDPPYALLMQHEEEPFLARFPRYRRVRTVGGGTLYAR
ncbi:MAG TPA: glycosyltransferase family 39 protein [Thermoanaerobaculia bacterium]|nr:glycosyltransferase family 39 protein [Thermoanaerobaculia bacterium]